MTTIREHSPSHKRLTSTIFWNESGYRTRTPRTLQDTGQIYQQSSRRTSRSERRRRISTSQSQGACSTLHSALLYNLCYAVNHLTTCTKSANIHMTATKRALRYLRGTTDLPIMYKRGQFWMVSYTYTDASFGVNPDNRKSTTGYLFFLGGGFTSFGSKTQSLTAQSAVDSELQALGYGAREAVYLPTFRWNWDSRFFPRSPSTATAQEH